MFTNIRNILRWILQYFYPEVPSQEGLMHIDHWMTLVIKWMKCNGIRHTIKRIKVMRLTVTRYICCQPLLVNDMMIGVTDDGFPKQLLFLKEYVDSGHYQRLRFVLTLLGVSRCIPYPVGPDYASITDPFSGKYDTIDNEFVKIFVKDFTGHFNPLSERPEPSKAFLTLKAGPLGGPAILSAQLAAARFTGVNLWALAAIGGDKFMNWVESLKLSVKLKLGSKFDLSYTTVKAVKDAIISGSVRMGNRRFLHIYDPECKHRLVACFDYISQLALNPFSEWCFETLRGIEKDRTFTQDPTIKDKGTEHKYHSFDLSSATDRFPIRLQEQLITEIAGPGFAAAWKALMINEPFNDIGYLDHMVKYSVGQPMGGRSSWAAFTLAHHMVVQYAAWLNGLYPFNRYILLGDDIVIYHDLVAKSYLEIISDLGVMISPSKSHVSQDTYEFAKRWFHKGIEISPVPLMGFIDNCRQPLLLYNQILDLYYKGRGPRSNISSLNLFRNLLLCLAEPSKDKETGFYEYLCGLYLKLKPLYSISQVKYHMRRANDFRLVYRNNDTINPEEVRAFMAHASRFNDYILPFDEVILHREWRRAASGVVNGMAMGVIRKLSKFFAEFKRVYGDALISTGATQVDTSMSHHPLTWAVYGSVSRFHELNKSMGYTTDLSKQLETITLLDLDKLASRKRTSIELVFTYRTLGQRIANQLSDDPYLIIAKARSMQFGRSLLDIRLAMVRQFPILKGGYPG